MTLPDISLSQIVPALIALFAFVVAYYTLLARERKNPLITTSITGVAVIGLVALLVGVGERLIAVAIRLFPSKDSPHPWEQVRLWTLFSSASLIVIAILFMFFHVLVIHNIQNRLRRDRLIRNTNTYLHLKTWWRRLRNRPIFEHSPLAVPQEFLTKATSLLGLAIAPTNQALKTKLVPSILLAPLQRCEAHGLLSKLADLALEQEMDVVYTTCSRHPTEFISAVQAECESKPGRDWSKAKTSISIIDGFTPHFGFSDSVHFSRSADLEGQGLAYVRCPNSFSGLHTAAATVFNKVKKKVGKDPQRRPQLVIYEGLSGPPLSRSSGGLSTVENARS
jgi:hypothetical protein